MPLQAGRWIVAEVLGRGRLWREVGQVGTSGNAVVVPPFPYFLLPGSLLQRGVQLSFWF